MTTCGDPSRDVTVHVWPSALGDHAIVVQIDTGAKTGQIRVNVNDSPVFDGDPESDDFPGGAFEIDWEGVHVSEDVAAEVWDFFESPARNGHFTSLLIQAILSADDENAERLGLGHREYVRAVGLWRSNKAELRRLAGRDDRFNASLYSETREGTE